jgi:hypothetical protein
MGSKKILFIEGTSDRSNGTLSQGFHKLIRQLVDREKMPRIIMGNGKNQAIRKFKNNRLSDFSYLLIDLDEEEEQKEAELKSLNLGQHEDFVFFMVQEMEAWFISQPEILERHYKEKITPKLPKTDPTKIKDPTAVLEKITKDTTKGKYHKVKDGTALLEMLNANRLKSSFKEFGTMVSKISQ